MAKKKEEPVKRIEDESELDNIDLVSDLLCGDKEIEAISANDIESVDPSKMISTGLIPLDLAFGGGITRGRTYEISGPESHGKSTLCDSVVASWLKTNKHALCLRIESESTMDKIRCKMIGIDLSRVIVFETAIMEEGYDQIAKVQTKVYEKYGDKVPLLIVWDTLTAAGPRQEMESEDVYGSGMMLNARINSRELRKLNYRCAQYGHSAIIIQQVREAGKDMYGNMKWSTTGGQALKHYCSSRVFVKRRAPIYKDDNMKNPIIGYEVELDMLKNKVTGVSKPVPVIMNLIEGYDKYASAATFAMENGNAQPFITGSGAWITLIDHHNNEYCKINGTKKLTVKLREDPYLMKLIEYAAYYNKSAEHEMWRIKYETLLKKLYLELDDLLKAKETSSESKAKSDELDSKLDEALDNIDV